MISDELKLVVECCRSNFRRDTGAEDTKSFRSIDWQRFLGLLRFHRIEGLAWKSIEATGFDAPKEVRAALFESASAIAAQNLQATADCHRLLERFEAASAPLLFLKGLTLGALAYRNPVLKSAIDIDLLISPNDLGKASELLRELGYRLVAPRESRDDKILHRWHRSWKESVWEKQGPSVQLDLHTRAADNRRVIPGIDVHSPSQFVEVGNTALPTLARDELFAYLAVHGASSAWFRLKWISDFAAMLHGNTAEEIERSYRRSQELGAGRAAGQALLLAHELFGTLDNCAVLRTQLSQDGPTERLFRTALRLITKPPIEPTEHRWGTLPIHWSQLFLLPGLRYKASELSRQVARILTRAAC